MKKNINLHSFHIPVMGTGFTIDTPVKVAKYGISSVVSLVDDILVENMREYYSKLTNKAYEKISSSEFDARAKRFTEYLNLLDEIVKEKFEELKNSYNKNLDEIHKYIDMLPDASTLKDEFNNLLENNEYMTKIKNWLDENLSIGSIDVNIMTKLDKANYNKGEKLSNEFNDAHASLRGFAKSNLDAALILSAGMNPRLYSYIEQFDDFFPNVEGFIKKRIIIKVSDFRSALIQGKFLAKKGLWVSEYRIESGLNCGGHAFATDGLLMGPILEEFKSKRKELHETIFPIFIKALSDKKRTIPKEILASKVTAQGGVGTNREHEFLLEHYEIDGVGWGTPFLLVPEATNVDDKTLDVLTKAEENDLYLSKISPLGLPFNAVKGSTQEKEKLELAEKGRPGSACPKKFLTFNTEFTEKEICTASRQYQNIKLKELNENSTSYVSDKKRIVEKECLCIGLANSTFHLHKNDNKIKSKGVSVCPGPNLAYFSDKYSLKEFVDHIYGRINVIKRKDRPNLFMKELTLYYDYLKDKIDEVEKPFTEKQLVYFSKFINNLNDGISYYKQLFDEMKYKLEDLKEDFLVELERLESDINNLLHRTESIKAV